LLERAGLVTDLLSVLHTISAGATFAQAPRIFCSGGHGATGAVHDKEAAAVALSMGATAQSASNDAVNLIFESSTPRPMGNNDPQMRREILGSMAKARRALPGPNVLAKPKAAAITERERQADGGAPQQTRH
jgi:hypothetical protein